MWPSMVGINIWVIQLLYIIGQHRKKISQQTKMPSRMTSHNRITKRQKKLIDLFGPENLKKDRVIEKKFAILFGDCRNKERSFLRDVRIKKKSKQQKARIQKRMEDLFGRENTKKDIKISKKIMKRTFLFVVTLYKTQFI